MSVTITGVDPGLVHTGVVAITLDIGISQWLVQERALPGVKDEDGTVQVDVAGTAQACLDFGSDYVFVEAYRPRSHFDTDSRMQAGVREIRAAVPGAKVINNTGVKKVVGQSLLSLFGMWSFATSTNHQDLRSAARIGIYGALKNDELNTIMTQFVADALDDRAWTRRRPATV